MASYNELNALIDAYINRNGVQAITGQILNGVLKAMVEQLGRGYTIMGAAIPTTDPGTPDGPECYFASEVGTYTNFDGLQVVPGELALLCYTPSDGWTKETIYEGFQEVEATIDGNVGTPSVGVSYADGVLSFDFRNMKGNPGDAAGFGTIGADITGGVGTPGVTVESSGPATAKNLQFHFTNLKGETGVTSVVATVDNTTGNPACTVSLVGQQLTLAFTGLKGAQGNTGVSADYPIAIVNNLTTNDPASALSAAQGVVLQGEITQLEAKVGEISGQFYGVFANTSALPSGISVKGYAYVGSEEPFELYTFDGTSWTDTESTVSGVHFSDNELSIGTVLEGATADALVTGNAPYQKLNLTLPKAGNPFKGLWDSLADLKDAITAQSGFYAYVLGTPPATTAKIYLYDSAEVSNKYWKDSGITIDLNDATVKPLSENAKNAIIRTFSKVAWIDENGQQYIDDLANALLMKQVVSINAVFTQGTSVYGTNSDLDSLKDNLVVTALYDDGTTGVLADSDYELSGTFIRGTSTITVTADGHTDTFTVTVVNYVLYTSDFYLGSLSTNYDNEEPHYATALNSRCSYPPFDLLVEGGKSYKVKFEHSGTPVANVAAIFYDQTALSAVANHQTIQSSNYSDSGWMTLTNNEILLSPPFDGAARLNARKDSDNSNFTEIPFERVIIDEVD